jgi:release factor glutamine methyltransferase
MGREFFVSGIELWRWWVEARQQAIANAVPATELDWLLQELTGLDRLALRLESFKTETAIPLKLPFSDLVCLWKRRLDERVPVQYLAGVAPWREFLLQVSPAVLIPRPETECLIDLAIAAVEQQRHPPLNHQHNPSSLPPHPPYPLSPSLHWADLGTGSGAIALGLAKAFPKAKIHAVDCSADALAIARHNAKKYHLSEQIQFYQGVWLEPLKHLKGTLSGIVSNPPYIPSAMLSDLQPEVVRHEPLLALDGGADGLDCIRYLVETAPAHLQAGGILLFEMMAGQAKAVTELLHQQGRYKQIQIHFDLAGIERFALAYRAEI